MAHEVAAEQGLTPGLPLAAQAKFRAVYGTQTFSNNNNWLRRKLLEGEYGPHLVYICNSWPPAMDRSERPQCLCSDPTEWGTSRSLVWYTELPVSGQLSLPKPGACACFACPGLPHLRQVYTKPVYRTVCCSRGPANAQGCVQRAPIGQAAPCGFAQQRHWLGQRFAVPERQPGLPDRRRSPTIARERDPQDQEVST